MKEYVSFIDFTNMSDEEKYKLLNGKDYEIERLNNIINEIEKWCKEKAKGRLERTTYDEVWIKLHELKGSE